MTPTEIGSALKAPFPADAISWRVGSTSKDKTRGLALAYIDSRDVQDRLDAAVGPENWRDEYQEIAGLVVCKLWLRINGEWNWKCDGAGKTDVEAEKGMLSDAFKRAAVKWGIGRYLYNLSSPWVAINEYRQIEKSEYGKLRQLLTQNMARQPAADDEIPHIEPPPNEVSPASSSPSQSISTVQPDPPAANRAQPADNRRTSGELATADPKTDALARSEAQKAKAAKLFASHSREVKDRLMRHLTKLTPGMTTFPADFAHYENTAKVSRQVLTEEHRQLLARAEQKRKAQHAAECTKQTAEAA